MTDIRAALGQLKAITLRPYYFILFFYHLRMYKRSVKKAEETANRKKLLG